MTDFDYEGDEIDYMSAACWNQYNIISLAGLGAMGFFIPGLWYLTVAAELAYLATVPSNERFQRLVRSEANRATLEEVASRDRDMMSKLAQRDKRRYLGLVEITEKIRAVAGTVDYSSRILVEQDIDKLDYLLRTFLRMLTALTRQREHLASVDKEQIRRDIRRLEKEMDTAKPRIKAVKQRNAEILRQRMSRLDRVEEDQELIIANLDTIEATLKLIRDNVVSLNNPEGISDQIDSVVINMQENERLMESMSSFLDSQAMNEIRPDVSEVPKASSSSDDEKEHARTH